MRVYLSIPVVLAIFATQASALNIAIPHPNGAKFWAEANYGGNEVNALTPAFPFPAVPSSRNLHAEAYSLYDPGSAQSNLNYSLTTSAFTFGFDSSLATNAWGYCEPFGMCQPPPAGPSSTFALVEVSFIPDANVGYSLSGFFNGYLDETAGMQLGVDLYDSDSDITLFNSNQSTDYASPPTVGFTLGTHGGADIDELTGSLTGTLLAGHHYSLFVFASFGNDHASYSFSNASGNVTLAFVPEPGTGLLVMAGVLGLSASRKRRAN
jgi:PEP-CTERM motif